MEGDAEFSGLATPVRRGQGTPDVVADLAERLERAIPDQVETDRQGLRRRLNAFTIRFHAQ
jgi:predicted short-subunit dehydrogenase-like oxidoreductase (DUF2520 family)